MRPHKLVIENFGPFVNTTVDFDALGNNVYLITGETGAGKTSILDAMVYSLYGVASGSARSKLTTESLHSDLAIHGSVKDPMCVTFSFSDNGKLYEVQRSIKWGATGTAQNTIKSSTLLENGVTIVNGKNDETKDDVTKKIKEILGLDADQFLQIIMLAQGEFKNFLEAGSDKRGEILGKIYDNRRQTDLQVRLKSVDDYLESELKESEKTSAIHFKNFKSINEEGEKEDILLAINKDNLLDIMDEVIKGVEKLKDKQRVEIDRLTKKGNELTARISTAVDQNKRINEYRLAVQKRDSLVAKQEEYDSLKQKIDRAEAAEKVYAYDIALNTKIDASIKCCEEVGNNKEKLAKDEEDLKTLVELAEGVKINGKEKIDKAIDRKNRLSDVLPEYANLTVAVETKRKNDEDLENCSKRLEENNRILKTVNEELGDIENELKDLDYASEAAIKNEENQINDLNKKKKDVADVEDKKKNIEEWASKLTGHNETYLNKQIVTSNKLAKYLDLKNKFISGQAGLLASELREKLETEESVVCMVCGTVHHKEDCDKFAKMSEETPSRDQVDAAENEYKEAKADEDQIKEEINKVDTRIKTLKDEIVKDGEAVLLLNSWEEISAYDFFAKASALSEEIETAKAAKKKVEDDLKRKNLLQDKIKEYDERIENLKGLIEKDSDDQKQLMQKKGTFDAQVNAIKGKLSGFPETVDAANKELVQLEDDIKARNAEIEVTQEAVDKKSKEIDTLKGSIEQGEKDIETREREVDDATKAYFDKLVENGFADENAYISAMSPDGARLAINDIPKWVENQKNAVNKYNEELVAAKKSVDVLAEAAGKELVDITALEERQNQINCQLKECNDKSQNFATIYTNDCNCRKEIAEILKKRDAISRKKAIIQPLADTANSVKKSFDRYVLIDFFKNIVDTANDHFEAMMSGTASLLATEDGSGRTGVDLGLSIVDAMGNKRHIASLSGGQSFEASLALALGLSEVVQMQSTSKIHIDSMFIDEGFGSLDGQRLDKAMNILENMSDGKRQIGIISHVAKLDERLTKKLRVTAGPNGSTVTIDVDERVTQ